MATFDKNRSLFGSDFVSDSSFSVSSKNADKTVFVELDEKPLKAKVVRGGKQVPAVVPDNARIDEFLSGVPILPLSGLALTESEIRQPSPRRVPEASA